MATSYKERQTVRSDLAAYLGARPDTAGQGEYLFFRSASMVFLLGMSAFLGYIYLNPLRERLYQAVLNQKRLFLRRGSHTNCCAHKVIVAFPVGAHLRVCPQPRAATWVRPYIKINYLHEPNLVSYLIGMAGLMRKDEDRPPEPLTAPVRQAWWQSRSAIWGLLILLAILGLLFWGFHYRTYLWGQTCNYFGVCTNKGWIKSTLKAAGPLAPLIFILIQALQVIFAPIPGEATGFIGGYLFGAPLGLLYSTLGLTLGSLLAFLIARWLEEHYVKRWIPADILQKFDFLMERQGALIAFILFIIPGFPKDYLCFVLGLSRMPLKLFLLIVTVGRLPGTLLLALQGAKVYKGDYYSTLIILGLCLALMVILAYYRETVYRWIRRFDHPENQAPGSKYP